MSPALAWAWTGDLDTNRGMEATPIVVDGVMYLTSAWSVAYAYNAKTGERLWKFDPEVDRARGVSACCDVVNRGVAIWEGMIYVGTIDGRLIALDAKTGEKKWEQVTVDQSKPYTITGAPRVVKGKVIIGNGGAELGVRGYISAYDAKTGEMAWRFYTDAQPEQAARQRRLRQVLRRHRPTPRGATMANGPKPAAAARPGTAWPTIQSSTSLYVGIGNGTPWNQRRDPVWRRQPAPVVHPRAEARHRRIRLALPDDARRNLGLHGDAADHACRHQDRRDGAQGADAGAEERLLLCARPRDG
jgi:quinohemoprotein ethanol dehydrogenase